MPTWFLGKLLVLLGERERVIGTQLLGWGKGYWYTATRVGKGLLVHSY